MYKRTVDKAPTKAVIDGEIMLGTFNTPFEDVNLIDAPKPFIKDVSPQEKYLLLHQWEAFQVGDKRFFAMLALSPQSGLGEVLIYDRQEQKGYKKVTMNGPGGATRTANNMLDSVLELKGADGSYYKVHNNLAGNGHISFEMKSDEMNFFFEADYSNSEPLVVMLPFSENRPFYSHKALAPGKGYVEIDGVKTEFDETAFMTVDDHQAYYSHKYWYDWVTCAEYQDGKLIGLQLTTNQALEPLHNNENCIWYDGKTLPLPDVKVYRSHTRSDKWLIKDELGMVDLQFEPIDFDTGMQLRFEEHGQFLDFYGPFGYVTGNVTTIDGKNIRFDRVFGAGERREGQVLPDGANIDN